MVMSFSTQVVNLNDNWGIFVKRMFALHVQGPRGVLESEGPKSKINRPTRE